MSQNATSTAMRSAAIQHARHDGLALGYLQSGVAGPPLIMLHGWGAFKELWWSTLRDLGVDHRCFALDLPGHGESELRRAASMALLADLVADFCADQGLPAITLFGHSMGGCVAVELALRRPDLVQRLVLVDAAVDARLMPAYARTYLQPGVGWPALRVMQTIGRGFRPLGRRVTHEHGGGWIRPWLRRAAYLSSFDPYGLHLLLDSLFATHAGERLGQLHMPTLVISGQFDSLVLPAHSQQLAARIPSARYVEIAGALHNPMDERPQAFVQAIRTFLQATPPSRPAA